LGAEALNVHPLRFALFLRTGMRIKKLKLYKAYNITKDSFELVYDIRSQNPQTESELTEAILTQPNIISVNILSPNSEVE
jgi:hypothetical protein